MSRVHSVYLFFIFIFGFHIPPSPEGLGYYCIVVLFSVLCSGEGCQGLVGKSKRCWLGQTEDLSKCSALTSAGLQISTLGDSCGCFHVTAFCICQMLLRQKRCLKNPLFSLPPRRGVSVLKLSHDFLSES